MNACDTGAQDGRSCWFCRASPPRRRWCAPNDPRQQHADLAYAPPMPPRIIDQQGRLRRPFVYPLVIADRLERRYAAGYRLAR